jgi:cytochrome b subunit of formate dehydrogenase
LSGVESGIKLKQGVRPNVTFRRIVVYCGLSFETKLVPSLLRFMFEEFATEEKVRTLVTIVILFKSISTVESKQLYNLPGSMAVQTPDFFQ